MIFRIGGLQYWYVPVIDNINERIIGIYQGLISTGMDNRTSKDCSLSKILDRDFCVGFLAPINKGAKKHKSSGKRTPGQVYYRRVLSGDAV